MERVVILGCGFTGRRVAERLLARGIEVFCTTRHPERIAGLNVRLISLDDASALQGAAVLHSIPPAPELGLVKLLRAGRPARVVYLSTTGVYGSTRDVDELTPPAPRTEREMVRLSTERALAAGTWSTLVLRPAAIYGPGRGIQKSMLAGTFRLAGNGSNFVSRIHVEDLARHAEAALFATETGAYPVGDDEPCTSHDIALFCAELLGVAMPQAGTEEELGETRRADRRVDGSAVRRLLGIDLLYPSYRTGIPASLTCEPE